LVSLTFVKFVNIILGDRDMRVVVTVYIKRHGRVTL